MSPTPKYVERARVLYVTLDFLGLTTGGRIGRIVPCLSESVDAFASLAVLRRGGGRRRVRPRSYSLRSVTFATLSPLMVPVI